MNNTAFKIESQKSALGSCNSKIAGSFDKKLKIAKFKERIL